MNYRILLMHLLDLPRIYVDDFKKTLEAVFIYVSVFPGRHICPRCGKQHSKVSEVKEFKVRDLPVFGKPCYLMIRKGRLHCACGFRGYEALDFVNKHQRQTKRFEELTFNLCDRMTVSDAAELMGINWKRAHDIDKQTLQQLKEETKLPPLQTIGVDEISIEKYHKYFTIVYDIENRQGTIFIAEGRTTESLDHFFEHLTPEQRQEIKVVCMDMWDAYVKSVHKNLPHAAIVFDRFHLKMHLNQCIDELRRSINRNIELSKEEKKIIKNKRWVLLKKQSRHSKKDQQALEEIKTLNMPLYEGYLLKEQFDLFYHCETSQQGKEFIENWFSQIPDTVKLFFEPFFKTIKNYLYGVISFFKHRYTNAVAEGLNNKIKVLKRMAYGYRDKEYFKLKILRRCGYLQHAQPVF